MPSSAIAWLTEKRRRNTERALSEGVDVVRDKCKTLAGFIKEAWPILEPAQPYKEGWHIKVLCDHLEAITYDKFVEHGLFNRLLVNVPPGSMKSLLVSVLWPAWEWGPAGKPWIKYVSTSASEENMERDCRKHRDLVMSDWYKALWPEIRLTRSAVTSFANNKGGGREGRAFAALTGGRGDRLLIDDPHSTESAESEADRITAIRIFRESVPLRVNDPVKSAIIVIMQRLHEHDVSGVAMALRLGYVHVMIPMEFEPDRAFSTPFGKDPRTVAGELFFPERFTPEVVARDKIPLGSYGVAGQFQQRPSARGGIMFRRAWFPVVKVAPAGLIDVRGWDLAASKENRKAGAGLGPAYTAGVKVGRTPGRDPRFFIKHVTRFREDGAAVVTNIKNTASQDGKSCIVDIPQDPGQAGKVQIQNMIAMLHGYRAYGSVEEGDKIGRAQPVAAQAEAGNISVVEGPWNEDFFSELELFPTGAYKDQVDAMSRAFARFVKAGTVSRSWPMMSAEPREYYGDNPDVNR